MHYLNASYTNWFKAKHKVVGVVSQGRYKSILVDVDSYAVQLSAYIHLNPIRGGIVNHPGEYQWSSYLDYMGKRRSFSWLDTQFTLAQFDNDLGRAGKKYENYVLNNLMIENPLQDSYKGIALGSEGFIEKIKKKIKSIGAKREIVRTKDAGLYTSEEIIQKVNGGDVCQPRRDIQMDYAAVSQACKRYEDRIRKN